MKGPLDGVRVLDLTRLLPGGFATLMMADLGADVVKVEEPGRGDYIRWMPPMVGDFSASHVALNRNKRSITLDLRTEAGRDLFVTLASRFDVVIESFRPGVLDRLGAGYEVLSNLNPRVVYCAITGYGQDGPRAAEAGHDINYIGYAGVLGMSGEEGSRPVVPGVQIGDLAGGGTNAVVSILAALLRRTTTGRGDYCDVSMTDGAASWLSIHAGQFAATNEEPRRGAMPLSGAFPCYRVYAAADGYLAVGALEPAFWDALVSALDRKNLSGDAYATGDRRAEVIDELEAVFARKTRVQWMDELAGIDACVGPVNDIGEAMADPQLRHREMFFDEEVPGVGSWTHVGNPIKITGAPGDPNRLPAPQLGEHTEVILGELGIDTAGVEELRASGAI